MTNGTSAWTDPRVIAPSVITGLVIGVVGVAMNVGIHIEQQRAAQEHTTIELQSAQARAALQGDVRVLTERVSSLTMRIAELEMAIRRPNARDD